jgi:hypothetical protein
LVALWILELNMVLPFCDKESYVSVLFRAPSVIASPRIISIQALFWMIGQNCRLYAFVTLTMMSVSYLGSFPVSLP